MIQWKDILIYGGVGGIDAFAISWACSFVKNLLQKGPDTRYYGTLPPKKRVERQLKDINISRELGVKLGKYFIPAVFLFSLIVVGVVIAVCSKYKR